MKYDIVSKVINEDLGRWVLQVNEEDLILIGYILESMEGLCSFTTIKRNPCLLEILVLPDFYDTMQDVLNTLTTFERYAV